MALLNFSTFTKISEIELEIRTVERGICPIASFADAFAPPPKYNCYSIHQYINIIRDIHLTILCVLHEPVYEK